MKLAAFDLRTWELEQAKRETVAEPKREVARQPEQRRSRVTYLIPDQIRTRTSGYSDQAYPPPLHGVEEGRGVVLINVVVVPKAGAADAAPVAGMHPCHAVSVPERRRRTRPEKRTRNDRAQRHCASERLSRTGLDPPSAG